MLTQEVLMESGKSYILVTYGYADENGEEVRESAIVCGSSQFRMPGRRMVDVYFRHEGRPGIGIVGNGVFASYTKCEEPRPDDGCELKRSIECDSDTVYVEYGCSESDMPPMKAVVHANTILDYAMSSGFKGRVIIRFHEGKWYFEKIGKCDGAFVKFCPYEKELEYVEGEADVVAKTAIKTAPINPVNNRGLKPASVNLPAHVNVKVVRDGIPPSVFNGGVFKYEDIDYGLPKKCAFAVYANGRRYEKYRDNLVKGLKTYVPGIDVVNLNIKEAKAFLPGLSPRMTNLFARLAIPLMRQFRKYDRVIWIDVDTDVQSGMFAGILNVETSDGGLAAAADMFNRSYRAKLKRRMPSYNASVYFNSGLIVMDLYKINAVAWENALNQGLSEFKRRPFRKEDQDLLNAFFDVAKIDIKYNYIFGRGREGAKSAWLVHYCAKGGHRELDRKIKARSERAASPAGLDRCVVVSPRHDFIKSWIRAYFASGNTIPLVIVPGPKGDWKDGDMNYCKAAAEFCGGMVLDCSAEWESSKALAGRAVKKSRIGWFSKKGILRAVATRLKPKTWAWIDDDAEVTGDISECFDAAEKSDGFVFTQFYFPNKKDRKHPVKAYRSNIDPADKITWNSFMIFHGDANERVSEDLARNFPVEDDEIIFYDLYKRSSAWHEGFYDYSDRRWQRICRYMKDIPKEWDGKVLHYTSTRDGRKVKIMWGNKYLSLPAAPFEGFGGVVQEQLERQERSKSIPKEDNSEYDDPHSPVDAVFVIGTGSRNGNEELRYALRNLDAHCKFIRNVYICGECPSWVDTSVVKHLKWPDRFRHAKDANIIDKLKHACEQPGIARRILFCSDDQFQTRECTWDDFYPRYLRRYERGDKWYKEKHRVWHDRLKNTLDRDYLRRKELGLNTENVFYWQPHIWMPIDRDRFIQYAEWCDYPHRKDTIIASGYFNFIDAEPRKNADHEFLCGRHTELPKATHMAYADGSYNLAMSFLMAMFPEKCRFERGAEYHITTSLKNISVVKVLE